jgi:hypothetical protein
MIFATPDFGASANFACVEIFIAVAVIIFAIWAFSKGASLLRRESLPKKKKYGVLLCLLSVLVPTTCWIGPSVLVRVFYGNYPLGSYPDNKITEGMTSDQVKAVLGTPHERHGDSWYYWIDSLGLYYFAVQFGPNGLVTATYGN